MACGCGNRARVPAVRGTATGAQYGESMLTAGRHLGAASNPATAQAGVVTGVDTLGGVTAMMRAAVLSSRVLAFNPPHGSVNRGTMRRVGAVIVPLTQPVSVVSVHGYDGQLPFDSQPMLDKPKPWAMGN